jgi:hypothetical protein
VLRASHIKPWAKSTNRERLNAENGIMLAAHVDALFGRGLMSFADDRAMLRIPLEAAHHSGMMPPTVPR